MYLQCTFNVSSYEVSHTGTFIGKFHRKEKYPHRAGAETDVRHIRRAYRKTGKEKDMADNKIPYKIYLNEDEMPTSWYNLRADMKNKPAPLLNPGTLKPLTAEELAPIFCEELVAQELDETTPFIEIPAEIREFYSRHLRRFITSSRETIRAGATS